MAFVKKLKKGNSTYAIEVEGYRDDKGKVKHRYKRYLGKVGEDGEIMPSAKEIKVDSVFRYGLPAIVHSTINELKLGEVFSEYSDELKTLTLMQVVDPSSLTKMLHRTSHIDPEFITPLTRKRADSALEYLQGKKELIEQRIYDRLKGHFHEDTVFYDITSITLNGIRSRLAEIGYPEFEPQINIGLCLEAGNGFPLFHEVFPGNISHKKTLQQILERLKRFGRNTAVLVFDGGVASTINLKNAKETGFDVITRIPLHQTIKKMSLENKTSSPRDMVQLSSSKVYVKEVAWEDGRLLICFNEKVRVSVKEKRIDEAQIALEKRRMGHPIKGGLEKYLQKTGREWQLNYEKLEEAEKYDGLYALYTSLKDMPKEKVVKTYFRKDRIEKTFQHMKNALEIKPIYFQTDKMIRAHVMLCHIAYLVTTWIEARVDETGLDFTLDALRDTLENTYRVHILQGEKRTQHITSLTPEQKKILDAFKCCHNPG